VGLAMKALDSLPYETTFFRDLAQSTLTRKN